MINILQLAAGRGSRFAKEGYDVPKPFIDVNGRPMFLHGLESVNLPEDKIRRHFLFQADHVEQYNPAQYVDGVIHTVNYYTDGAATSAAVVIADSEYQDEPWFIIDNDFVLEYNSDKILENSDKNCILMQYLDFDTGSSYSCVDDNLNVLGVAEKQPISRHRNTGQYYWSSGALFMEAYRFYKENNIMPAGEYYLAPLYNYAIQKGYPTVGIMVEACHNLGTPVQLEKYLNGIR